MRVLPLYLLSVLVVAAGGQEITQAVDESAKSSNAAKSDAKDEEKPKNAFDNAKIANQIVAQNKKGAPAQPCPQGTHEGHCAPDPASGAEDPHGKYVKIKGAAPLYEVRVNKLYDTFKRLPE